MKESEGSNRKRSSAVRQKTRTVATHQCVKDEEQRSSNKLSELKLQTTTIILNITSSLFAVNCLELG